MNIFTFKFQTAEDGLTTRALLEQEGYLVATHNMGFGATNLIRQTRPDLVLLDINMPALSGDKLAEVLTSREDTQNIPIIFYSSNDEDSLRKAVHASRVNGYICKGNIMELKRKVAYYLDTPPLVAFRRSWQPAHNENAVCTGVYMSNTLDNQTFSSELSQPRDAASGLAASREIEKELKKSQRQLAEAQRIAHIGSWEWNIEENSMTWSDEMFRIFGLEPRPLFPTFEEVLAYIHEEDRAVVQESFRRALENLEAFGYEVRVCRPDGTVRAVYSQGNVIVSDYGSPLRLIAIEQDITERKAADAARKRLEEQLAQSQKMEAIGRLAGGIAHDFNNILSAIQGYGELIQIKLNPTDPLAGMVGQILYASAKAARLTQSMLTFSRKQVVTRKPLDVNEIIKSATALLVRLIGEDIEIIINLCDKKLIALADSGQLEQVLMNLATNARDAMPDGGRISISTTVYESGSTFLKAQNMEHPGPYLCIEFSDTGQGMVAETIEKMYEPFFTTKEVGKGTGLGLSIIYGIVRQNHGAITVASEPMKGTTFYIYFPLLDASAVSDIQANKEIAQKGSETVLLAEDDNSLRQLMKTILSEYGYNVITARDGDEAITKYLEHDNVISLVILDVIMPKRNGREVYEEINRISRNMKYLFVSGYTGDILERNGIQEPDFNFLPKPVSPQKLLLKIREILDA